MTGLAFLVGVLFIVGSAQAAQCESSTTQASSSAGKTMKLTVKECQERDVREIAVSLSGPPAGSARVLRLQRRISDAPRGGAALRDVDGDGTPEVEVTGPCGAGPNCERQLFRLSQDARSMFRIYEGSYSDVRRIGQFVVTDSRSSCCSWEYLAYAMPPPGRALSHFQYSVSVGSIDDTQTAKCRIQRPDAKLRLRPVKSAPPELLPLCNHYGQFPEMGRGGTMRR